MITAEQLQALAKAKTAHELAKPGPSVLPHLHLLDAVIRVLTPEQREQMSRIVRGDMPVHAEFPELLTAAQAKAVLLDEEEPSVYDSDPDPAERRCGCKHTERLREALVNVRIYLSTAQNSPHNNVMRSIELINGVLR